MKLMSMSTERGLEQAYAFASRMAAADLGQLKHNAPVTGAVKFCKSMA